MFFDGHENDFVDAYTFRASDLAHKWGFSDGDVLSHKLLIAVIRTYLIPLCPAHWDYDILHTHHNPFRVKYEFLEEAKDSDIEIIVTGEMLEAVMKELKE